MNKKRLMMRNKNEEIREFGQWWMMLSFQGQAIKQLVHSFLAGKTNSVVHWGFVTYSRAEGAEVIPTVLTSHMASNTYRLLTERTLAVPNAHVFYKIAVEFAAGLLAVGSSSVVCFWWFSEEWSDGFLWILTAGEDKRLLDLSYVLFVARRVKTPRSFVHQALCVTIDIVFINLTINTACNFQRTNMRLQLVGCSASPGIRSFRHVEWKEDSMQNSFLIYSKMLLKLATVNQFLLFK